MNVSHISNGDLDSLDSKSVPTNDDINVAKFLWNHASDHDKEPRLIKWLTITLGFHDFLSLDVKKELWKTLEEFLCSQKLQSYLELHEKEIEVKSLFTNRLLHELSFSNENHLYSSFMKVSEALLVNKKLFSEFGFKFQTMAKLTGAWILTISRFFNCTNTSKDLCDEMAAFLEVLLGKLSKAVKEARIKNAPIFLIKFVLNPVLQLCVKSREDSFCFKSFQKIHHSVIDVFICTLFSKPSFCAMEYTYNANHDLKNNKSSKSSIVLTNEFFSKLRELISEDQSNKTCIAMAYQIYLQSYSSNETSHERKISFLLSCVNVLKAFETESCVDIYLKLFQLTVSNSLHTRTLDEEVKTRLESFYSEFTHSLLKLSFTSEVQDCLLLIAECSHSAIEQCISLIMKRIFEHVHSDQIMDYRWARNFFNHLFHTFHSIRKPLSLFEKVVESLMEECARCVGESNQHCIVLCGAVGRAQSSSSLQPGLVIDLWESLQGKMRELIPELIQKKSSNNEIVPVKPGKKRKSSCVNNISKKPKLDPLYTSIIHCLLIMVNSVLEQVEFLQLRSGLHSKRSNQLLEEVFILLDILRDNLSSDNDNELMGQYYHLLTTVGHRELLLQKYNVDREKLSSAFDINDPEKWELGVSRSDFSAQYRWKQWQCFRVQFESGKMSRSSQQNNMNSVINKAMSNLLSSTPHQTPTSGTAVWDGLPETIVNEDVSEIATLSLLRSFLSSLLPWSNDECLSALVNLLLRNFNDNQQPSGGHVSASSLVHDMLEDYVLLECRHLHEMFLITVINNIKDSMHGKKNKPFKFLLEYSSSICSSGDVVDDAKLTKNIVKLFKKPVVDQEVKELLKSSLKILFLLPYRSFSPHLTSSILTLILCFLSCEDEEDQFHHQCLDVVDDIIGSNKSGDLVKYFPQSVFLPYFTGRPISSNENFHSSIRKLLLSQNNLDFDLQATVVDMLPTQFGSDDNSISIAIWLLELGSNTMKDILHFRACSDFVLRVDADSAFSDGIIMTDEIIRRRGKINLDLSDKDSSALSDWVKALQGIVKTSRSFLKHAEISTMFPLVISLLKHSLLVSFYIDHYTGHKHNCQSKLFKKLPKFKTWLHDVIEDLNNEKILRNFQSKLQLLLMVVELALASKHNQTSLSIVSEKLISPAFLLDLIQVYNSSMIQQSGFNRFLLDRIVLILHILLSSSDHYTDFFSVCRKDLIVSNDASKLMARISFLRVIIVNYSNSIKPNLDHDDQSEPLQQLYIDFFNDVFYDLTRLVNRLTTTNQSQLATLQEAFQAINDMLKLKKILPGRLVTCAIPSIQQINLIQLYRDEQNSNDFLLVFTLHCNFVGSILFHSSNLLQNIVALIFSICRKLLRACMAAAKRNLKNDKSETAKQCSYRLERLFHSIASHHKSTFSKFAPFLVADYLDMSSTTDISPLITSKLDSAMFHMFSICSESDHKFMNSNLNEDTRPLFHNFLEMFNKKFKYTGWV